MNRLFFGSFERQIALDGVREDKAEASFRNGVLTVTLPKPEGARQGVRRIAINSNQQTEERRTSPPPSVKVARFPQR